MSTVDDVHHIYKGDICYRLGVLMGCFRKLNGGEWIFGEGREGLLDGEGADFGD